MCSPCPEYSQGHGKILVRGLACAGNRRQAGGMNTDDKTGDQNADDKKKPATSQKPKDVVEEVGGRDGPDPTRYGDWENKGILSDF
jgi:hypothetical protein